MNRLACNLVVLSCAIFFFTPDFSTSCWAQYRTFDGTGNNLGNPDYGAAVTQLIRLSQGVFPNAGADYPGDQSGSTIYQPSANPEPLPSTVPHPRTISNMLFDQSGDLPNSHGLTSGVWQWGQFLDHDLDLTRSTASAGTAHMLVEQPDPDGMGTIMFRRSEYDDPATGTGPGNPRQQLNAVTSYIDASQVYGSSLARADALRAASGGKLKTSGAGKLLPMSTDDSALGALANDDGGTGATMFVAGDIRANEQIGLTAMHTLFVREHNRLADALAGSGMDEDEIYFTARRIVGAEMQAITYNEFLPSLLGAASPRATDYSYDPNTNASIANEFSTAAFRFGHSMLNSGLLLTDPVTGDSSLTPLRDTFFRPDRIMDDATLIDQLLLGLTQQRAQEIDAKLVDDVRTFLFGFGGVGVDLASLNIQRGRDHGLPRYNVVRQAYGLSPAADFSDISTEHAATLAAIYESVDDVDAWVGGLAESHAAGSSVGDLVRAALIDQFTRLRDGDAFFYTSEAEMQFLQQPEIMALVDVMNITMDGVIAKNTSMNKGDMPLGFFFMIPEPNTGTLLLLAILIFPPVLGGLRQPKPVGDR